MSESRPESYWSHLYWLTVLEEQKSYTRAAEKLGISKSAISQKISELERVTGKTLVHRTTRSVSLSDDGLRLVAELNEPFGQQRFKDGDAAAQHRAGGRQIDALRQGDHPLPVGAQLIGEAAAVENGRHRAFQTVDLVAADAGVAMAAAARRPADADLLANLQPFILRRADRKSVRSGKCVKISVELGCRSIFK